MTNKLAHFMQNKGVCLKAKSCALNLLTTGRNAAKMFIL